MTNPITAEQYNKYAIDKLKHLIMLVGPGFHPDTNFAEYINIHTEERTFDDEKAIEYDFILAQLFNHFNDDIYDIGLVISNKIFNAKESLEIEIHCCPFCIHQCKSDIMPTCYTAKAYDDSSYCNFDAKDEKRYQEYLDTGK